MRRSVSDLPFLVTRPQAIILAGPNGAGKTTAARGLLHDYLKLGEFVNADTIAAGLAAFAPERAAFAAGRIMLSRLHELAEQRANFAFETTMASRTFAPWLASLREDGYRVQVVFLWLRSSALAVQRVKRRVRQGGHDVPRETIERRYAVGLRNFFELYMPIADRWRVYDNSRSAMPRLIASGDDSQPIIVHDQTTWQVILRSAKHEGGQFDV